MRKKLLRFMILLLVIAIRCQGQTHSHESFGQDSEGIVFRIGAEDGIHPAIVWDASRGAYEIKTPTEYLPELTRSKDHGRLEFLGPKNPKYPSLAFIPVNGFRKVVSVGVDDGVNPTIKIRESRDSMGSSSLVVTRIDRQGQTIKQISTDIPASVHLKERLENWKCPEGHVIDVNNGHGCKQCPAGSYATTTVCVICPQNSFSEKQGSPKCESCPEGTESKSFGSTTVHNCLPRSSKTKKSRVPWKFVAAGLTAATALGVYKTNMTAAVKGVKVVLKRRVKMFVVDELGDFYVDNQLVIITVLAAISLGVGFLTYYLYSLGM